MSEGTGGGQEEWKQLTSGHATPPTGISRSQNKINVEGKFALTVKSEVEHCHSTLTMELKMNLTTL